MSKIRMAILGCGGMAGEHVRRFLKRDDVEIIALCDVAEEGVLAFRDKHLKDAEPQPQIFTDAAQMYAEAKPDAVTIVTPHTMHLEHASQALNAGLHVLLEKPMVTNSDDAYALAEIAEKSGKVFAVGYNTTCTPEWVYVREVIRNGELGKLQLATGWLSQNWRKNTAGKWRQKPELSGGGEMYDSGAHLFNSLVWSVDQPVAEVHAFVDNMDTPVDINGSVNIRFENGVFATVTIAGNCAELSSGMQLFFEKGRIELDPCAWSNPPIKIWRDGKGAVRYPALEGEWITPNINFIEAIHGQAEVRANARNGIIHSELMDAIYESARTGQVARPKSRNAA